jgi:V/A-type H+-transporting ATPase subunit D
MLGTMSSILPTKSNLLKIQNTIKISKQGQELLERENNEAKSIDLRKQLDEAYSKVSFWLRETNVDVGIEEVSYISKGMKIDNGIDIKYKTVMGVEIPSIVYEEKKPEMNYGIYDTPISLDEAIIELEKVKKIIIELAVVENTIERLNINIAKVQKRSNALSDIIIPKDEKIEKEISENLSEREREEFSRLKVLKKNIN